MAEGRCAEVEGKGEGVLKTIFDDAYVCEYICKSMTAIIVSWLTQSDQSDFSIGGVYFSYTPPRRCIFFAWGLDLLRIMGPCMVQVGYITWQHASFTRLRRLF